MKISGKYFFTDVLKTFFVALIFSAIAVLGLSLIMAFVPIKEGWIHIADQVIKVFSLLLASFLCIKDKSKGLPKGLLIGLFYAISSYFLFSFATGGSKIDLSLLADVGFGALTGAICAAIAVSFGKTRVA